METLTTSARTATITVTAGKTYALASNGPFFGGRVNVAASIAGDDTTQVPLYSFDSNDRPMTYTANGSKIFLELVGGTGGTSIKFSATELF